MKKGSSHTLHAKELIKEARKRQGSNVWNKGKKGYGKYKGERPCKVLRKDPNYYLLELEGNAKRAKEKGYHDTPERRKQIEKITQLKQIKTGAGRPKRDWSQEEIKYLKENYQNIHILDIALKLGRSWMSVGHKAQRLNLQKYHKWN